MRLTKGREREIRLWIRGEGPEIGGDEIHQELLNEIDALREDLNLALTSLKESDQEHDELMAERDLFREERETWGNEFTAVVAVKLERDRLREALGIIAAPKRPDGTYNRCREACEQLASEALVITGHLAQAAKESGK